MGQNKITKQITFDVSQMSCDFINAQPVNYDWAEALKDDQDDRAWDWAEMVECPTCGKQVAALSGSIEEHFSSYEEDGKPIEPAPGHEDDYEGVTCASAGDYHQSAEGPMMNYYYPCEFPGDAADAARLLPGVVCAVTFLDGSEALALTGGGMDLSWEICEAYLALGLLPPLHFAGRLPRYSGMTLGERTQRVLAGALRSAQIAAKWAGQAADDIRKLRADLEHDAGKTNPTTKRKRAGKRAK